MVRVALLIGVSRYPPGLNPLPHAQKDVELMRRVLKQPQPGFEPVICLSNEPLATIQETIEELFKQRAADDLILFLFSGYVLQDADGKLYFATPETAPDRHGGLIKSRTIPVQFVQEMMDASPAKQQVVVLDSYFRQTFSDQPVAAETPVDLQTQLGGAGRVILTASATTQHVTEPPELNVWSYCRYLIEGVETAAATDDTGVLTAASWHNYACRKLKRAAPAKQPQIYGSEESRTLPLLQMPVNLPAVRYRKLLEERAETAEVDAAGTMFLTGRTLLDDIKHTLFLSTYVAAEIESQTLRPIRDYRQRLQAYQERFSGITQGQDATTNQIPQYLKQIQQALCLTDKDTAAIDAVPRVTEQQRQREQYQTSLAQYERLLLATMQRQTPLTAEDRHVMQRLQQILGLHETDVAAIETQLQAQIATPVDSQQPLSQPPPATTQQSTVFQPPTPAPTPTPPPATPNNSPENTRPSPPPTASAGGMPFPGGGTKPGFAPSGQGVGSQQEGVPAENTQTVSFREGAAVAPPENQSHSSKVPPVEGLSNKPAASSSMNTPTKDSKRSYTALIIPGLLLAALAGSLLAVWSSIRLPTPFNNQTTQQTNESTPAPSALVQAAERINLGIKAQEVGDTDGAIKYFNEAVALMEKECTPATNVGSTQCGVLARAHSNRSYAYFQQQNFARALEDANVAVTLDSNLPEARINLANARFKQNDLRTAIQDYDQALQLNLTNPLRAGIHNNRGNVLFSQKNTEAALKDYSEAIRLDQNYADAYFNRALAYETLANSASAVSDFQQAARLYQGRDAFKLAEEAERRAKELQQKGSPQTPLPPASASSQ